MLQKRTFGVMPNGKEVVEYTLNDQNYSCSFINYGARITRFAINNQNIVCGYDSLSNYLIDDSVQGAVIGRYANRIKNARFSLNGQTYQLAKIEGEHHLHGGNLGYANRFWTVSEETDKSVTFTLVSPNGDEGYPGNLTVSVRYTFSDGSLILDYFAHSDMDTPLNLTNHVYFNLHGCVPKTILDHVAVIHAEKMNEVDDELIPTGRRLAVENTPYDFRTPHAFGERMPSRHGGYDVGYIFENLPKQTVCGMNLPHVASFKANHLCLDVFTDCPTGQLYTACQLGGKPDFSGGVPRLKYGAFCFETQEMPDAPNHGKGILRAGTEFHSVTVYRLNEE